MKTNPRSVLIATATALLVACFPVLSAATVVVDPGHGGRDAGATEEQVKESEIVLLFAKALEAELSRLGHVTLLTRSDDRLVPLKAREKLVVDSKPNVVIGLHLASSKDPAQRGIRIFQSPQEGGEELLDEDRELPDRLAKTLTEMDTKQQVTKHRLGAPFLGSPKAILIELGYLSNPDDRKLVLSPEYQQKVAKLLAGVINHR